jgi:hypothetical protein
MEIGELDTLLIGAIQATFYWLETKPCLIDESINEQTAGLARLSANSFKIR